MYLIYGESFRLIDLEIKKIVKNSQNIVTINLINQTLEDVINEARYVSLFSEQKYIIVKNANFFSNKKDQDEYLEILFSYMEYPNSLSIIIFTMYDNIDKRKKVTKIFKEKYKIISINDYTFDDLMFKIREYVIQNNFKISNDSLKYVINCCQNNFDIIINELNKIFLYYNSPQEIFLEDIKNIISRSINNNNNNFKFVEVVLSKNIKKALSILEDLYALKVDPIVLIILLAREYRLMYSINNLISEGYRQIDICKELGLQNWQVEKMLKNSAKYYNDDLAYYLKKLAIIDYEIKSGKSDRFIIFKTFLLEID